MSGSMSQDPDRRLRRQLRGHQLFFIAISSVIGGGLFSGNGGALGLAGPTGLVLSVALMGVLAGCVVECLGELIQLFPVTNAIYEYVHAFVDEELAWVAGVAYWYTYASIVAEQMVNAAKLTYYWNLAESWRAVAFYFVLPLVLLGINMLGIKFFGWFETVAGAIKVCMVGIVSILLFAIGGTKNLGGQDGYINEGLQNNPSYALTPGTAFCYAFPSVAYSYVGIETIAMAAYEARPGRSLASSARVIHIAVFILYLLCTIGIALTVSWKNPNLPNFDGPIKPRDVDTSFQKLNTTSAVMIAVLSMNSPQWDALANFLNVFLIFSIASEANTALYIASRTAYGLASNIRDRHWITKKLVVLHNLDRNHVPAIALWFSVFCFYWFPWLELTNDAGVERFISVISMTSSVSCLIVWACICLAFVRFHRWTDQCRASLLDSEFACYVRGTPVYEDLARMPFSFAQPFIGYLGLLGCTLVFIFASASWWNAPNDAAKFFEAYGAHIVWLSLWVVLKLLKRRQNQWFVPIGNTDEQCRSLKAQLEHLRALCQRQGSGSDDSASEHRAHGPRDQRSQQSLVWGQGGLQSVVLFWNALYGSSSGGRK